MSLPRLEPEAFVDGLGLRDEPAGDRPRVVAVMIGSADGRATVEGRSVGLGHPVDRALLRGLRAGSDALLAGTATLRAEGYATLVDDDAQAARVADGLRPHPVLATTTRSLSAELLEVPVFGEAGVPIRVFTGEAASPAEVAADLQVVEEPSLAGALRWLREHDGVRSVACEGGPTLLRRLVAEGLVDDLLLTVAPLLAAGDGPTGLVGDAFDPPVAMELAAVHRADDHLFLHYAL